MELGRRLRCDEHGRRPIVQPRGISRRHGAFGPDDRLEFRQRLKTGGARMLVALDDHRLNLALGNGNGNDLGGETPCCLGV